MHNSLVFFLFCFDIDVFVYSSTVFRFWGLFLELFHFMASGVQNTELPESHFCKLDVIIAKF